MRLLHTADWHVGKRLFGIDRLSEMSGVLAEIRDVADREAVDVVLVAGDIIDRRIIEPEVLAVCLTGFQALAAVAPVVVVTGNHDDPGFWRALRPYLEPSNIHVVCDVAAPADAVRTFETRSGEIHLACLPWPDPASLRLEFSAVAQAAHRTYADLVADLIDGYADALLRARTERGGGAVLLGHLMVEHAKAGGGERELTLAETYAVKSGRLPTNLDYIALGHIHKPQALPGFNAQGRYCGSPIQLDFGERATEPEVLIVDIDAGTPTSIRSVPLTSGRRLVRLRSHIDDLVAAAAPHGDAWLYCEVELDHIVPDLVRVVRELVPNALRVEARYATDTDAVATTDREASTGQGGGLPDIYRSWYASTERPLHPGHAAAFAAALGAASEDE